MSARLLMTKITPKGWAVIGCAIAAAVMFVYFVFHLAAQPSYATLMTGLDPAQTGKLTSTLDTKGIAYQIQNGGTALAVESDKTAQARIALAGAGLLTSAQPGFSLFDKQQLGASNFQQQITYQRALEGQLAQTIDNIQGVSAAQVQLALPNPTDQLFSSSSAPATAAVLLSGATSLDPSQVRGIAKLVASSVQGLQTDHVTITDSSGELLWPTADSGASGDASGVSKQAVESRYDATLAAQVGAMLAQTLGPGKAQVVVNADLNADQATQDTLQYQKRGVPLDQHSETESLAGQGGKGAGTAGTASNIPAYAQTAAGNSNYKHLVTDTTFGVNKTVTHSVIAPGKVNRQTVSVLVDSGVPASEIPALKSAVSDAVGLDAKRGDVLSLSQVAFAKPTAAKPASASPITKYMKYAKYGAAALGSILFLVFVGRYLRRREREGFTGEPMWLRELEAPRPLKEIEMEEPPQEQTRVMQLRAPVNVAKKQVEDLVERDPDRVAQQVRAWMAED